MAGFNHVFDFLFHRNTPRDRPAGPVRTALARSPVARGFRSCDDG